jgi:hypothetical protein
MKKHAALAIAIAAVVSVPVFAQSGAVISSSSGTYVNSGTGLLVTPGVPIDTVAVLPGGTVLPSGTVLLPATSHLLPGAVQVQSSTTTVMGAAPAVGVSGSRTIVTNYWVNVPAGVEHRADFQRWLALKP